MGFIKAFFTLIAMFSDWLLVFIPIFVIFIFIIRYVKKLIPLSKIQRYLLYMTIFVISFFLTNKILKTTYYHLTLNELNAYTPIFSYLEEYKDIHGKYPSTLDFNKLPKTDYEYHFYKTFANDEDYILKASHHEFEYLHTYNYCSNPKYEECYEHEDYPAVYKRIGKWIEFKNLD